MSDYWSGADPLIIKIQRHYSPPEPLRPGELSGTSAWVFLAEFFDWFLLLFLLVFLLVFLKLLFLFFAIISPFSHSQPLGHLLVFQKQEILYKPIGYISQLM